MSKKQARKIRKLKAQVKELKEKLEAVGHWGELEYVVNGKTVRHELLLSDPKVIRIPSIRTEPLRVPISVTATAGSTKADREWGMVGVTGHLADLDGVEREE